jgi:hypothetical protein
VILNAGLAGSYGRSGVGIERAVFLYAA